MKINAYGLLELLFVIALGAIGLLLSIHYYSQVRATQKVTEMQLQMQGIYKAVLQCMGSVGSLRTSTLNPPTCMVMSNLIQMGLLSDGYSQNPWGGPYNISVAISKPGVYQYMAIIAAKVPPESCAIFQGRLGDSSNTPFPKGTYIQYSRDACTLVLSSIQL